MSDVEKLKMCRAYVEGTITSKLNQLKDMFELEAVASAPGETLVLALISDAEDKIKTVEELMLEDVDNNNKFVLSVKTQICMYRDSFPNKGCSQNNSVNIESNRTVKLPLPPIIWSLLRIIAVIPLPISLSRKPFRTL